ncbi:hypothetical protein J637_1291 [Acinetobacter baumannii 273929]|nr:hypothetical protein J637_1291 [Acinetobacter baumannii 273929]
MEIDTLTFHLLVEQFHKPEGFLMLDNVMKLDLKDFKAVVKDLIPLFQQH